MKDVIGIGSAFIDYFFEADIPWLTKHGLEEEDDLWYNEEKEVKKIMSTLPYFGKSTGGSTPNTLAVLAKLGKEVAYYGVIGKDTHASIWEKQIGDVSLEHTQRSGTMSVCACILTSNRRKRTFVSYMNTDDNLFFENFNLAYLNSPKYVHITQFFLDVASSFEKLVLLVKEIKKPKISFSPGVVYSRFGVEKLLPILEKTDVLFLNEAELSLLTGITDYKIAAKKLLAYRLRIIVCTRGEKGVFISTHNQQYTIPGKFVETIIDATGAGDAFAAGFLQGLLEEEPLEACVQMGNDIASKSITDFGLHWIKNI